MMKAVVIHGLRNLRVEDVAKPEVGEADALLKVRVCGICGSDLHFYRSGTHQQIAIRGGSGWIPGHEYVGDVVEVGPNLQGLAVGDRIITIGAFGAMAEYIRLTPASPAMAHGLVFKIPVEVSDEEAATIEPLCVGLAGMEISTPAPGETVVVMGVGPIGLGLVQCLKALTDTRVIAVGRRSDKRLALAKRLGADVVIRAADADPYEKVLGLTGATPVWGDKMAAGVDIVYDCAGHLAGSSGPPACQQGLWMLRPFTGRLVLIGAFEGAVELDLMPVLHKQLKILGSQVTPPDLVRRAIELVRAGKVNQKALVSHVFPLDRAREAFETQMNTEESVKVLIKP